MHHRTKEAEVLACIALDRGAYAKCWKTDTTEQKNKRCCSIGGHNTWQGCVRQVLENTKPQNKRSWSIGGHNTGQGGVRCCHLVFYIPNARLKWTAGRVKYKTRDDNMLSCGVVHVCVCVCVCVCIQFLLYVLIHFLMTFFIYSLIGLDENTNETLKV